MILKRNGLPKYVSLFVDRHGKRHYRFRKLGGISRYMPEPETIEFRIAYREAMRGVAADGVIHPKRPASVCVCYFVGGDHGLIKIGMSIHPASRLASLNTGSPIPLRIFAFAPGGESAEQTYHRQFAHLRRHGEWFERGDDLLAEIARLNPRWESPVPVAEFLLGVRQIMFAEEPKRLANRAVVL